MSIFKNIFGKKKESGQPSPSKPRFYAPDFDKYDEFGQIVTIFDYTLNPDFAIANKAAETINRLFNSVQVFKNKELYEGSEKSQYTCKCCGSKYSSLSSLTASSCSKSPTKKHQPAL